ncbi:hypothetical protein Cme02nite_26210 [Catellatospora methionotrophica]|uniref:Lipoprotein n=1 Tax=Catellatospora methionotrophica TaxID=121620 RepID=A0A8J3LEZ6_9ACTN|nr:hypothetical protein [Catellatospora methionotrophica]GIG14289.1 hypothetical protein Cme02nite_26210 [Catellatospora methionotrophica]
MRGAFALATVMMLGAACAQATQAPAIPEQGAAVSATPVAQGPDIVHLQGVRDVRFGTKRADLEPRLDRARSGCSTQVTGMPQGNLVFAADDRLVMMWFDAPLRTPEGVHTGSPLADVRAAYPDAEVLTAPAGTHRFDGLLVTRGDRGYLFLHDGTTVQKAVAGYGEYLGRLFNTGFGSC